MRTQQYAKLNKENKVIEVLFLSDKEALGVESVAPTNNFPIVIGDDYIKGNFYRNGEFVKSFEQLEYELQQKNEAQIVYTAMMTETLFE